MPLVGLTGLLWGCDVRGPEVEQVFFIAEAEDLSCSDYWRPVDYYTGISLKSSYDPSWEGKKEVRFDVQLPSEGTCYLFDDKGRRL